MRRCHLKPAWEMDLPHMPLALWLDASVTPPDHTPQPCFIGPVKLPHSSSHVPASLLTPHLQEYCRGQVNTGKLLVSVLAETNLDLTLCEQVAREGIAIQRSPLKS